MAAMTDSDLLTNRAGGKRADLPDQRRWLALAVLCMGSLMIVLDTTIVNVALPSIRADLGFSESALAWVVNAYLLTFGGFLLLGGRLGDLYGHRRLFLAGIAGGGTFFLLFAGLLFRFVLGTPHRGSEESV